jgi:glucose/arabinose dehydrogenase
MRTILALIFTALAVPALAQTAPFGLDVVAEGFDAPVYAVSPPGDKRLFVVEQSGTIRILADGQVLPEPFLDVSDAIAYGGEQGLLGLAFHPDYAANGRFFVNYTNTDGNTRVVEFKIAADNPDLADPQPVAELLAIDQPYGNHNGGWIDFGPDGLLYVGMGDGGAGGDPEGNGQDMSSLLGKILTIDVDAGGTPQIFASGLRNPWRNAFDGDALYIADVGQGEWEEVNVIGLNPGQNLGWNIMEGAVCFESRTCDQAGLTLPVHVYSHDVGCSITGGYVYRGAAIPALEGHYLFGDFCSGVIYSFRHAAGVAEDVADYAEAFGEIGNITSFGRDSAGEIYVMVQDGRLLKIVPAS